MVDRILFTLCVVFFQSKVAQRNDRTKIPDTNLAEGVIVTADGRFIVQKVDRVMFRKGGLMKI